MIKTERNRAIRLFFGGGRFEHHGSHGDCCYCYVWVSYPIPCWCYQHMDIQVPMGLPWKVVIEYPSQRQQTKTGWVDFREPSWSRRGIAKCEICDLSQWVGFSTLKTDRYNELVMNSRGWWTGFSCFDDVFSWYSSAHGLQLLMVNWWWIMVMGCHLMVSYGHGDTRITSMIGKYAHRELIVVIGVVTCNFSEWFGARYGGPDVVPPNHWP